MNRWIKAAAVLAMAATVAGLSGGAGATNAPTRAASAGSKEVARSAASTAAARRGLLLRRANLETVAGVKRYLRAIGVNPSGVVIQRGAHNYAGPSCPGAGWSCTSTAHPVVQVARRGGKNTFLCTSRSCAVIQTTAAASRIGRALAAAAATPNMAKCVKTTGVTQSCSISQTAATTDNTALVYEDTSKESGLTQSAVFTAQITQQQATGSSGANKACVHQNVTIDGSTTAKKGQPVTVNIQSHESITITQDSFGGGNTVENAVNQSVGVYTCDDSASSALTQIETLKSLANGTASITQNLDMPGNGPNLKLDIEQNQSPGFFQKASATGPNKALFSQETKQTAIANTSAGPVNQVQSSDSGGILAKVNQWSKGVSKADATQKETQCEHAAASDADACAAGSGSGTPSAGRTQRQFGPIGSGGGRSQRAGRTLAKVGKGICPPDCSTQADNPANSFVINQTSTQTNDTGTGQTNTVDADCATPGTCTGNQTVDNNQGTTTNGNAGTGKVTFNTACALATSCKTTANFPSRNILVSVGNGQVQMWNSTGTTLLHTFATGKSSFTTGLAFDPTKNFYVTDFGANDVTKFNSDGTLSGSFGSGYNANPESIVFDVGGNAYVGQAAGTKNVLEFSSAGDHVATFSPAIENQGTDWIDLASDGCTLYYTSEGTTVKRFDVCTPAGIGTQLEDFATGLPGSDAFAIKLLPDGGALVADTDSIVRLDNTGAVVRQYGPGGTTWFSLALDPAGTSFWAGDAVTGDVKKFDLTSGSVLASFNTGSTVTSGKADGLAVAP